MFKKILLSAILGLSLSNLQAQTYHRVRVHTHSAEEMARLQALGLDCQHGHHRPGAYLENDYSDAELEALRRAGLTHEILIEDVSKYYVLRNEAQQAESLWEAECGPPELSYPSSRHFHLGSMGGFLSYDELMAELDSMAARYPHLISRRQAIDSSNTTYERRYLHWVRISDNPNQDEANEPEILYTALHHSREPLSAMQLVYYMWYLLENYQNSPEIRHLIDETELYFVPCVNPDGYAYNSDNSPSGGGLWRKNRRSNIDGSYGVDLNRNYGYAFAFDNSGSSGTPGSDTYRGPYAFSEPETQNIRYFCNGHDFAMALNYHSYGNMLIYPWAFNSGQTPDSTAYREFAALLTHENRFITGTNDETVGYSSNGDADDWFYGEQTSKNKILSMTPETGYQDDGFWPASNKIEFLCRLNLWQNLRYAQCLLNFGIAEDKGSPIANQTQFFVPFSVKRYGYQGGNFQVSLRSNSPYVLSTGGAKNLTINQFEQQIDSIEVILSPSTPRGSIVPLLLELNQGNFILTDTIFRLFGSLHQAFSDNFASLGSQWQNLGTQSNWEWTNLSYHSPSGCLTDSRLGNYPNNRRSEMLLTQALDLSQAQQARLRFWAKWDIEDDYDYVQVLASDNGGPFVPLCGRYTQDGSSNQDAGQPVFDGNQAIWVEESMPLDDFIGSSNLHIKIILQSDAAVRRDGFYLDDFEVEVINLSPISNLHQAENQTLGNPYPNPASVRAHLPLLALPQSGELRVYDALGRLHRHYPIEAQQTSLDVEVNDWPSGLYFYVIECQGQNLQQPQRLYVEN